MFYPITNIGCFMSDIPKFHFKRALRCRWSCCTPRLMQEFNQKPQSGRVPKGAPEQTLLQRTKDHKQLRQGRKERARGGMVGLRDETDLLGCTTHYTCWRPECTTQTESTHFVSCCSTACPFALAAMMDEASHQLL